MRERCRGTRTRSLVLVLATSALETFLLIGLTITTNSTKLYPLISVLANDNAASYFFGNVFHHSPAETLHYRGK